MNTLKNTLKVVLLLVAAVSFSANAMHADFYAKKQAGNHLSAGIDTAIHASVDVAPTFPGGIPAFTNFLAKNLKYPAVDRENKITGKVFVIFVVEPDGSLSHFNAVRGPSETLKAEAIRALASSPKWQPGKQNGEAVRVQFTVPINFELPK
ncbi:energy transducer TonB [Mucilaginibacter calamicampi]|uniref:Energy transducer TonB n=1 Tax=Mucilaginibacter calamicampi TaxID=1302352 RepID=A0ABW2YXM3_9SPHI